MNKILTSGLALSMLATAAPMTAFAAQFSASPTNTPVKLTVAATPIDVTVDDAITMNVATNTNTATVTNLTLNNNSKAGVIQITNMNVTAKEGWTKVGDDTNFAELEMNAKKFSLKHDTYDLNTDATLTYEVNPSSNKVMNFTGKSGAVTQAVKDAEVADVILTIGYKTASPAA